jgi:hypothetical protein
MAPVLRFIGVRAYMTVTVRLSFEACKAVRADVWASHVDALVREKIRVMLMGGMEIGSIPSDIACVSGSCP